MPTISPKMIYDKINEKVVGQEAAKRIVSTSMFLHWVRFCRAMRLEADLAETGTVKPITLKKSNILLTGSTGTGKTLIVREAAVAIQQLTGYPICPVLEVDCTELTGRGWEGESLTHLIRGMYDKHSKNDLGVASAVIFLDEFDKICKPAISSAGVDHNKQTQYNLLKAIEGTVIPGSKDGTPEINTSKMLFIFAGNFSEIREKRAAVNKQIGFNRQDMDLSQKDLHTELESVGCSTQLVGRIAQVGELKELTKAELMEVLDRFLLPEYTDTWSFLNRTLKVKKRYKEDMVQRCFDRKTGARGLQADLARHVEGELFNTEFDT